jgi:selenoprotein W-related protein
VRLTASLIEEFKTDISALTLIPLGNGIFNVKLDGKLVFSKYETGRFPEEGEIAKFVRAAIG